MRIFFNLNRFLLNILRIIDYSKALRSINKEPLLNGAEHSNEIVFTQISL